MAKVKALPNAMRVDPGKPRILFSGCRGSLPGSDTHFYGIAGQLRQLYGTIEALHVNVALNGRMFRHRNGGCNAKGQKNYRNNGSFHGFGKYEPTNIGNFGTKVKSLLKTHEFPALPGAI